MCHLNVFPLFIFLAFLAVDAPIYDPEEPPLHIYGGEGHKVFLGCINCASGQSSSIWNRHAPYGQLFSDISIWNRKGTFGSAAGEYSPWNPNATKGPVLLDESGEYYGRFTANVHNEQTSIDWAIWMIENYDHNRANIREYRQHFTATPNE